MWALRVCISVDGVPLSFSFHPGKHPNAGDGLWGSSEEVPTFLYAMPLGGNRVFLEETCLVAKPALPFAVLKRRLERRLDAMGVKVKKVSSKGFAPSPACTHPRVGLGARALRAAQCSLCYCGVWCGRSR